MTAWAGADAGSTVGNVDSPSVSTVTVPVVAALGLGLASAIPGRSPLLDGFGLIAFASVFPIVSVLGYDMSIRWIRKHNRHVNQHSDTYQDREKDK